MSKLKYKLVLVTEESSKAKRTEGDTAGDFTFELATLFPTFHVPFAALNSRTSSRFTLVRFTLLSHLLNRTARAVAYTPTENMYSTPAAAAVAYTPT
jgi:hypothetical protein